MPTIKFTSNLKRFFPQLGSMTVEEGSVAEVIAHVNAEYAGIKSYVMDEQGSLRKHVHIFINNNMINDRVGLSDQVSGDDEIYIMQALSGG